MLDQKIREAILLLAEKGYGTRRIAAALKISRGAVRDVLEQGSAQVPPSERAEKAEPHRADIVELYHLCKGNLVRVHEELVHKGAELSYQALTAFCRRHDIGHEPQKPAGQYHFEPGQEMQHDTSPHEVKIAGKGVRVQTASLVLCFSRMLFFQFYLRFTRFYCKVFLDEGVRYIDGACKSCMIDNTHVVVLTGTGRDMVPVPEMAAFGEHRGFAFAAHEKGDANRSGRVERPFDFIENNFLAGREFTDLEHANREARAWCDQVNARFRKRLRAAPRELFASERAHLRPLPAWLPEVYQLHHRIVDIEGYVTVHQCRYSAPYRLIGRQLEVRETRDQVELFDGPRRLATHKKLAEPSAGRITLPEHRPPRGQGTPSAQPPAEEQRLLVELPDLQGYVAALKKRRPGHGTLALRRLATMLRDYPRAAFLEATRTAAHYGLYDLDRLERMVLKNVARDFFPHMLDAAADADPAADTDKEEPPDEQDDR